MQLGDDRGVAVSARQGPHVPGPVAPSREALSRLSPLGLNEVALETGSALGTWQETNRLATIPHCLEEVVRSGALGNLERVAAGTPGTHEGMVFSDSDVYKILEALAWESVRGLPAEDEAFAARATKAIAGAQREDGYLDSYFLGQHPEHVWRDLRWGHELYCAGHLLQGAVAAMRAGSVPALVAPAARLVDHLIATFSLRDGDGRLLGVCGHPEIETALVEYFRATGDERALALAGRQVDLRGRPDVALPTTATIDGRPFVLSYFLHHLPVRLRGAATGHAVRELYLQSGVVDVASETRDAELLAASERIWEDLFATKTYLTGAHGSRHRDESIGDPYELPSDRAYAETCAGIASFQWNWRLLLATGKARYADAMERVLWNTIAGAVSRHGTAFFYSNALQLRTGHEGDDEDAPTKRLAWYACACCPPNLARLLASIQGYLVTRDETGLQVQMLFSGTARSEVEGGEVELALESDHPFGGRSTITLRRGASGRPFRLSMRVPSWTARRELRVTLNGEAVRAEVVEDYLRIERRWEAGDRLEIEMAAPVRLVRGHPRVDAIRSCAAVERGPLVYCLEADDLGGDVVLEDVTLDPAAELDAVDDVPPELGGYVRKAIRGSGFARRPAPALYRVGETDEEAGRPTSLTFLPYFARAHRSAGAMRVWVPAVAPATVVSTSSPQEAHKEVLDD